jgi:hypothetical protein
MEKSSISRFIQKYNLSGLIESVKWCIDDKNLNVSFISDDKSVLGTVVTSEFDFKNGEFSIYDTTKLTKMLSVLAETIDLEIDEYDGKSVSLSFKDNGAAATYMLADPAVIPVVPNLKQLPEFDIEITLDSRFMETFNKATLALSDENTFTFMCSDGNGKIILGHSNINTNRIYIDVECKCEDGDVEPISFSAQFLREMLVANRDAQKSTLKISTQGLAHAHFEVDGYTSDYYLVQIQS